MVFRCVASASPVNRLQERPTGGRGRQLPQSPSSYFVSSSVCFQSFTCEIFIDGFNGSRRRRSFACRGCCRRGGCQEEAAKISRINEARRKYLEEISGLCLKVRLPPSANHLRLNHLFLMSCALCLNSLDFSICKPEILLIVVCFGSVRWFQFKNKASSQSFR